MSDTGITNLFENIGKTYLVPGFDYKSGDKKAQEEFMKKKKEEESANKKEKAKRGMKLKEAKNEEKEKKRWC